MGYETQPPAEPFMPDTRSTLLKRVQDPSDGEAWTEFVALYEPLLLRYIGSRGLNDNDARDVVQNIFTSLVRVLVDFRLDRNKDRFRTWLWRVAHSALIDWARRKNRHSALREEWAQRMDVANSEPEPEWEIAFKKRVLEFSLERIREKTQPKTWSCFEKHILKGRPAGEVAERLGMMTGAVYVNASRVLERVRLCAADYMDDDEAPPDVP